jgi:hypothetical protein
MRIGERKLSRLAGKVGILDRDHLAVEKKMVFVHLGNVRQDFHQG